MFTLSAVYYDKLYAFKDYHKEARYLADVIHTHQRSAGRRLLDLACGSGAHLVHLSETFDAQGLDLSPDLLDLARRRLPGLTFHQADMADFDLGEQFDVLTCLFSSIGYLQTLERVRQAVGELAEPWFTPAAWRPGAVHSLIHEEPDLKIARLSTSKVDGRLSYFDFHYLLATPQDTTHFVERHELGLFETQEQLDILNSAGFEAEHDPQGPSGRGLFIARNPL
ncbi:MAG TPA: class I SAM-dependent methyltransferase [Anaerolinea sp.]|nr:class I SAM-dependent methyltransferase [Anaerolinea sp.]